MSTKVTFALADLSDDDRRQLLVRALSAGNGLSYDRYVRDVFPTYLVFKDYGSDGLYRCDYTIADDLAVTLGEPTEVVSRTVYEPVTMSADGVYEEGGYRIYPSSLLFEAGDYPDKNFTMTASELLAAASTYQSAAAKINLQHAPKMLVGKLGEVRDVWTPDQGKTMFGKVALPLWLDDQLTEAERRVSCEFDRKTKALTGLALTPTPRVEGAALMAAFQEAAPKEKKPVATKNPHPVIAAIAALFSKANVPQADIDQALDTVVFSDPSDQVQALQATVKDLQAGGIKARAEQFADSLIEGKRALPAERSGLVAAFTTAAEDDAAAPKTVTFAKADGSQSQGSRLDALTALHSARPAHKLTDELLDDTDESKASFSRQKPLCDPIEIYARLNN